MVLDKFRRAYCRIRYGRARLFAALLVVAILAVSSFLGFRPSPYVLGLIAGGVGMALLIQQPAAGLLAMSALSFTLPLEVSTGSAVALTPPVLIIPALAFVWLVGVRKRSWHLPASRTILPLLLFVGSGLLSLVAGLVYWDPAVPRADNLLMVQLAQWSIFALSAAIFVLAGDMGKDGRWLEYATWAFLVLSGLVILEVYVPWLKQALDWSRPERAKSGIFFPWVAALTVGQLLFNRRLGGLARSALAVLWTGTAYVVWFMWSEWTSALAPFTAATITVVWLWVWRRSRVLAVAGIAVLAVAAVVLYPVVFELSGGQRELEYSWGGRLALYRAVIDLAKAHPLLGLGPAAYRHYGFTRILSTGDGRALYVRANINSHNNYIDIFAQMGLVGCGLFLWFITEFGVVGWKLTTRFCGDFADGYVHGVLGGLSGSLVAMMLVDWLLPFVYNVGFRGFRTSALAWMFMGGLVAMENSTSTATLRGDSG